MFDNPKITARAFRLHMRPQLVTLRWSVSEDIPDPRVNDACMASIALRHRSPNSGSGTPVL